VIVVDPVCGMKVNSGKAKYKSVYKGKVYYFCSLHCKKAFEENPEHYLAHGPSEEFTKMVK
jgi:YHS domain-containing protein